VATQAGLYNYLRLYALPEQARYLGAIGFSQTKLLENIPASVQYVPLPLPALRYVRHESLLASPMIYVNQKATFSRWKTLCPQALSEVNEDRIHLRREMRQSAQFLSGLFTDGVYPEAGFPYQFAQVILADMPYTLLEMTALTVGQERDSIEIAFAAETAENNRRVLEKMYPESEVIREVYRFLLEQGRGLLSPQPVTNILDKLSAGAAVSEMEFLAVLYILADLGLCEYKKNGNIISIKLSHFQGHALELRESNYYLEGRAAKQNFLKCRDILKIG
jgi:hypothetical protein